MNLNFLKKHIGNLQFAVEVGSIFSKIIKFSVEIYQKL